MGVDLGRARIGIALSDLSGILASPFTTISHNNDSDVAITAIVKVAEMMGITNRVKYRAIFYYLLVKELGQESKILS